MLNKEAVLSQNIPTFRKDSGKKFDHCQCIQMKSSVRVAILKRFVKKDIIHDFLDDLNLQFNAVWVQIIGKEELLSLDPHR